MIDTHDKHAAELRKEKSEQVPFSQLDGKDHPDMSAFSTGAIIENLTRAIVARDAATAKALADECVRRASLPKSKNEAPR